MSNGWSGPDPNPFSDGPGADYELGTRFLANSDVTITGVRVWGHPTSASFLNRRAKVWTSAGVQEATVVLPDALTSGWVEYALDVPVSAPAGTTLWVSYSVVNTYGAVTGGNVGYPRPSLDTLVTANSGGLQDTPGAFPGGNPLSTFYGIDIVYSAGLGGNQPPVVGISAVSSAPLVASATLTVQDETPSIVGYVIEWGDGQVTSVIGNLGPHTHTYAAAGLYAVMVTATDAGGQKDSAATAVQVFGSVATGVLALQRLITSQFIKANPSTLALHLGGVTKTASGGTVRSSPSSRPAQVLRLIDQSSAIGSVPGPTQTGQGTSRRSTHQLLGAWNATIGVGDWWLDANGHRFEVVELLPFNGYEVRARVIEHG
jgi:hypothetical protein